MRCSKCGTENLGGKKFCSQCGSGLVLSCPKCGAENAPASRFCGDCGSALALGAEPSATSTAPTIRVTSERSDPSTPTDGERKTVTALFADIKGSMDLIEDLDPEEARAIVDPALKLMMDAVHRFDGYIVQSTGDGIFALFGAPVAHEDHPQRSLYAALRMQDEVKRYAEKLRAEKGVNLQVRVGANTGEVVVRSIKTGAGHVEYTPIGHSTSLASRLQALAAPGSIAVSETVRKLAEGYFALKPLGPARIKGVSGPVDIFEVTGLGPLRTRLQRAAGRGLTKFVGRGREMEAMHSAAELARAGHGQIVAAMAEAGTGKSRLIFEFKAKNQLGWNVLETFSVSHGKASAYFPVIDLLHNYFKITGDDDQRARRAKITGNVLTLDRALEDTLPYIFALLGASEADNRLEEIDAQIRRRRTLDAIKRLLLRESLNQPLMVIFEDLHWIDEETQAFLNLLADSIGTAKILLLVNYRPEYSHQWNSKTYYTQLRLDPLGIESADEMLSALLGDSAQLAALKKLIAEKTEGNPFFMEETVLVMFDERTLVRNGSVKLTKPMGELKIPPTVQAILTSRIDRLPPKEKDLLQTLAIIGREFPVSLIRAVSGGDDLETMLQHLQLAEFIYEQPAAGDAEYTFKHALTQEVAYNSILIDRRKQIHERAGAAIETLFANQLDDHLGELARHYGRSANSHKAVTYLRRAARQAWQRSAVRNAVTYLETARQVLAALPEDAERDRNELAIQLGVAGMSGPLRGYGSKERLEASLRARELCHRLGDETRLAPILRNLGDVYVNIQQYQSTRQMIQELNDLADRTGDPGALWQMSYAEAHLFWRIGNYADACSCSERVLARYDDLSREGLDKVVDAVWAQALFLCFSLIVLGHIDRAREVERELSALVQKWRNHRFLEGGVMLAAMYPSLLLRDATKAEASAQQLKEIAQEVDKTTFEWACECHGWAIAMQGQLKEGIAEINGVDRSGLGLEPETFHCFVLSDSYLRAERAPEALRWAQRGLATADKVGERQMEADLWRLSGEALLLDNTGKSSEAERSFRSAIEVARGQRAKLFELRASTSLARLLCDTSRPDEARAMLSEIYNWFTEGFDTADLKDAKTLLDELGAEPNP